jgi:hypothetical protein
VTDGRDAEPATNALGVVDPIRIPIPSALPRAWQRLPVLAKVFVGLTILDIVARAVGFAGTSLFLDLAAPLSVLTAFFPRSLLILFPALLLLRRPDADRATPLVLQGAVLVALAVLLGDPLGGLVGMGIGEEVIGASLLVSIAATALKAAGWIAIAIGLLRLAPVAPSRFLAGLSNLVFAAIAGLGLVYLVGALLGPRTDIGIPGVDGLFLLSSVTAAIGLMAWAFLGRVIVRGADDIRRPLIATRLALPAFAFIAVASAFDALVAGAFFVMRAFGPGPALAPGQPVQDAIIIGSITTGILGTLIGTSAVIVAFGLGLADTSPRVPAPAHDAVAGPEVEPLAWPAPAADRAP